MAHVIKFRPTPGKINCASCKRYDQTPCHPKAPTCSACCQCSKCRDCGKVHRRSVKELCPTCYKCRTIGCNCAKLSKVEARAMFKLGLRLKDIYPSTPSELTRITSCELEVCNWKMTLRDEEDGVGIEDCITHFHHDGSIEGDNPIEIAIGPIPPTKLDESLTQIKHWIGTHRAEVNATCGFHVHVNTQDFDMYQLRRFIRLYEVLEPTFFSLVGESRATAKDKRDPNKMHSRPNTSQEWAALRMCYDIHKPDELRNSLLAGIYLGKDQMQGRDERRVNYSNYRYKALNLHSHYQRGTIEFRHHEGTLDITRISGWIHWCAWIVELAARMYDSETFNLTRESILYGKWQRPWGYLHLPEDVVKYVEGGRDVSVIPVIKRKPVVITIDEPYTLHYTRQVNTQGDF